MAHHPHLHKPPGYDEVHFFDGPDYSKGIEYYHELMPETSAGEITYEKTPKYMVIPEVPGRIYAMNSTIKLIAIVCNPVNRAFSDYTHVVKSHYFKNVSAYFCRNKKPKLNHVFLNSNFDKLSITLNHRLISSDSEPLRDRILFSAKFLPDKVA